MSPDPADLEPSAPSTVAVRRSGESSLDGALGVKASAAHAAMSDLYRHRMWIYWIDFLGSLTLGYGAWFAFPIDRPFSGLAMVTFAVSVLGCYRAVVFIHEIAHMPKVRSRAFHLVWNVMCGIPLLIPSFLYDIHKEHHAPQTYGSVRDGEYRPYARLPWRSATGLLAASLFAALALIVRFLLLAPLSWLLPSIRMQVLTRTSSLIIDEAYRREVDLNAVPTHWLFQEVACFAWSVAVLAATIAGLIPLPRLLEAGAVMAGVSGLNSVRVLVAHRYRGDGEPMMFAQQVLDSQTFPNLTAELWAPVGLRFHAEHHLLPNLPYHALPQAHRRLMDLIPNDSPFRATIRSSLRLALCDLFREPRDDALAADAKAPSAAGTGRLRLRS